MQQCAQEKEAELEEEEEASEEKLFPHTPQLGLTLSLIHLKLDQRRPQKTE